MQYNTVICLQIRNVVAELLQLRSKLEYFNFWVLVICTPFLLTGLNTELFSFSTTADHSKLLNTKIITSTLNSASKDSANHPHMRHMTMTWKDKKAQPWYSWKVLTQSQTDFSQKLKNYPQEMSYVTQVSSSWRKWRLFLLKMTNYLSRSQNLSGYQNRMETFYTLVKKN